jgi:hypothetical protein
MSDADDQRTVAPAAPAEFGNAGGTETGIDADYDADAQYLVSYEERLAERRRTSIEAGRRKGGVVGAAMAGAMMAVAEIYEGPPKEDAPVTVEASSKPHDLDKDGFGATFGEVDVAAPALQRLAPVLRGRRRR